MNKPDYGIDAPGVIRNLLIIGIISLILTFTVPEVRIGRVVFQFSFFNGLGVCCTLMGILMILYSKVGKFSHRDKMLDLISWRGDESVLDVGTGRGLMMIGAAKRLGNGKSTGIDIWSAKDLSSNNAGNAYKNAELEGVRDKVEIFNESAVEMQFPDETFDLVFSNLCIHNIPKRADRDKACLEIARVLKKGGKAVISDFKNISSYRKVFDKAGFQTQISNKSFFISFPPLKILVVSKS